MAARHRRCLRHGVGRLRTGNGTNGTAGACPRQTRRSNSSGPRLSELAACSTEPTRVPSLIFGISWPGSVLLIVWGGASFIGAVIGLVVSDENRSVKYGHLFFDGYLPALGGSA